MDSLKRMRPLLGTYVEIGIKEPGRNAENAIASAFSIIEKLHHLLSFHSATSDLTRLNQAEGEEVAVHAHTLRVLKLARSMTIASAGLFNCTLGGALVREKVLPDHGGINVSTSGVAADIQIYRNKIKLRKSVKITLDGIAKGYAVDCAIATLKRAGVTAGWVNAGGDLRVYGDLVLPVHRREYNGQYMALGGMQNAAIATSIVTADAYTDSNDFPGKIMSDLTIPTIGTWSVMAHQTWRADALTKVACLAKESLRNALINQLGGILVSPQGNLQ
jgi:FAD:protein FMN transferase